MFNFIRMLDAHDYPKAYLDIKKFKILLKNVKRAKKKTLKGEFEIVKIKILIIAVTQMMKFSDAVEQYLIKKNNIKIIFLTNVFCKIK